MAHIRQQDIDSFAHSLLNLLNEIKVSDLKDQGPTCHPCSLELNKARIPILKTRIRFFQRMLAPLSDRKSVLELGSGYGFNLLIMKFLGFQKVHGVELVKSVNDTAVEVLKLAKKHMDINVDDCTTTCGDAESTDFKNEQFQNIVAIESISHIPSFDRFMREINRILKPNGMVVVSDGNNICCPYYRRNLQKTWTKTREKDLIIRVQTLRTAYPDLDPHLCASIALHTELLSLDDAKAAVPAIVKTNKLPMNLYFEGYAPIQAQTGTWAEYGFEPPKLAKDVQKYGFSATPSLYAGSGRGGIWPFIENTINMMPDSIRFLFRPTFFLHMTKTDSVKYLINV